MVKENTSSEQNTTSTRSTSRVQTSTDLERCVNAPGRAELVKTG